MVSIQGYFEWYDLSKGFECIHPQRGNGYGQKINTSSIVAALDDNNYKYYSYLVQKAQLTHRYDDIQACYTIFAPRDDSLDDKTKQFITNADINLARQLIDCSTIPRMIRGKTLMEPGVYWADTRSSPERLLIDNRPGKGILVSGHRVLSGTFNLSNGIVYQISGLIIPGRIL